MNRFDEILSLIENLLSSGLEIKQIIKEDIYVDSLGLIYEQWFTKSQMVIAQIIPERLNDFRTCYRIDGRNEIDASTYTISDFLIGISISQGGIDTFDTYIVFQLKLSRQIAILRAAKSAAPSILRNIRTVLQAELFDSDLDSARMLLQANHLRSAGVVCGVVLEGHLKSVIASKGVAIRKAKPVLSDLNDALKDHGTYDIPMWRFIQRLADIRNICCHSTGREPKSEEVEDLISGADKVIKTVF